MDNKIFDLIKSNEFDEILDLIQHLKFIIQHYYFPGSLSKSINCICASSILWANLSIRELSQW